MCSTVDPPSFSQQQGGLNSIPESTSAPFAAQYDTWPRALQVKSDSPCLDQKIAQVKNIYSKDGGGSTTDAKVEKIREMLAASNELERKLEFLKRWFGRVENQLSQPIHVHSLDDEAFDHILNKHQELHQDIVNHTESVLSVIELCDMLDLDSESDIFPQLGGLQNESTGAIATSNNNSKFSKTSAMDLTLLRNRCRTVGKRWDRITAQSQDRLARINRAWDNCRKFLKSCEEFKEYIESFQTELSLLQNQSSPLNRLSSSSSVASRQLSQSTDEVIQQLSERRDEFNKSLGQLQAINEQYRILYHDAGVGISMVTSASHGKTSDSASELGPRTGLRNKLDEINKLWSDVSSEFDEAEVKLRRGLKQMEEFSQARQTLMMWLMDLDIRIDNIDKFFASDRLSDRVHQLKEIQRDVEAHQGRVDYLNLIGQRLIATFGGSSGYNSESDVNTQLGCVDSELKDFNMIAEKIKERLLKLSQKLNCSKDSFDSRRGKSVDSDVRSRGASSNLSPRSRALKHLQLKTLGNHNLLTSSSYDLRTSFSSTNQGSLIGFRKSASLSALNKDRCLTGTTTTTDSSERRSNIDLGSRSSKYSRSTDRRSLTCSAPRSIVSEDFSANIGYSYSSLFLENPFDSEKSSFFAHRPTLLPSDHNDLFLKRHDKGVVSIQSNGSGRSSPGMLQKLDGSVSGLDWDPYEPLQHSSDNLGLPPVPFTNCSSTTVNVDLNHNRSDFPSYHLTSHDRSHSTNSSSKFADPMKKQFTVKQKGVLLKFQPTIEDLKEALAECKTNLDGSEGFLRSPTPTGEMCEVVKVTFSGTIASCKASVDVVKSVYNKLQAQDPGIFHKSNYKNLSSSVEDCSQRWDVIKQRAMEKRRRLKHNYQLWNQFLADVTSLRNWIVQYRPTYPVSEHIAAPSSDLHSPEDISHRQFMRFLAAASNDRSSPSFNLKKKSLPLTHLEQLIGMHKEFMKDLNGNKTSLMSINMYLERYHSEDEVMEPREPYSGEHTRTSIKADVESLNVHFHELCHQALQTQLALQDCVINNEELNANLADIILWFETVEKAFEALQVKYNSKPPENVSAEVHAALLQLKAEVNTNQARVEALRSNAEQLLLFTNQTSFLVDSSSHSSSMHSKSSGLSSMSPYTEESSEFKERLYVLCSRVRSLKTKLSNSLELVESNAKMVRSDSSTSWERMPSMESASLDALVIPGTHSKLAALQNQSQLPLNDDNNNDDSFNRDAVVIQQTLHSHGADISCQSLSRNPQMPSKDPSSVNPQYLSRNPTNAPPHLGPSAYDSQQQLLIPHKKHVKQSLESTTPLEQLQSFSVEKILSTCEPYPANSVKIQGILMELLETSMLLPVSLECPWLQNSVRASSSATVSQTEKVSPNWKTRVAQWVSSNVKFIHFIILLLIFTHFIWRVSFLPSVNVSTPNTLLGINVELNYPHGPSPF